MRAEDLSFPSAGGMCRGVLYRPDDGQEPLAVVVVAHGFSGTRLLYDRKARQLVGAGVAVLDFDPRCVGTSPGEPRQRIDMFEWLDDLRAAIAYVRSRPDLDDRKVGIYGSSSGGGLAFAVAAEDPGIRAIALDVPMLDGGRATGSPRRSQPALIAAIARDALGRRLGRPPVVLPAVGDIGSGAVLQNDVDGFWRAFAELDGVEWIEPRRIARHPQLGEWRNEATALELLRNTRFRPARRAAAVRCPTLAHLSRDDKVVPFEATKRTLEQLPNIELRTLLGGHFAPFYGDGWETAGSAQIEFFARQLAQSAA